MHLVAITRAGEGDTTAAVLASDLRITAYEARLLLAAGMPALVRRAEEPDAIALAGRLRAGGHMVVTCDEAQIVPSSEMIDMRRLRLGPDGVVLDDRAGAALRFDDVLAFVAARHRHSTQTSTSTSARKFSASRALISGGLVMTATVKSEGQRGTDDNEQVLYVFRRDGATPWILREHGSRWSGLGRPLAPSATENFRLAVDLLRKGAPGAAYDDRLMSRKASAERVETSGTKGARTVKTSSETGVDLLAHVVALAIAQSPDEAR